jgi:RHS repeat-associated protein
LNSDGFGAGTQHISVAGVGSYTITWGTAAAWAPGLNATYTGANQYCPISGGITPSQRSVITSIQLPNGQVYAFQYHATYGTVNKVIYPSGDDVTYTWALNANSQGASYEDSQNLNVCTYRYGAPSVTSRIVHVNGVAVEEQDFGPYSTNYNDSVTTLWATKSSVITTRDLVAGQTSVQVYNYSPRYQAPPPNMFANLHQDEVPVESTVQYQDANFSTLKLVSKNWYDPYELACEVNTLDNDNRFVGGSFYTYGSGGVTTDKKEYDYGQLSSGATCSSQSANVGNASTGIAPSGITPVREIKTWFQAFANSPLFSLIPSILNKPCQTIVYGSGARVGETDFFYDNGSSGTPCGTAGTPSVMGAGGSSLTGHDAGNYGQGSSAPRANLTTKVAKCFPLPPNTQSCSDAVLTIAYDETGQAVSSVDPNGNATGDYAHHTTYYGYIDRYSSGGPPSGYITNAYLTTTTYPATNGVVHAENFQYGYADGKLTQHTDQNNQNTTYSYNDLLDRLTNIQLPTNGGHTTIAYADTGSNPSVTITEAIDVSRNRTTTITMDGHGRPIQNAVSPDLQGVVFTDTRYDGLGRKLSFSNPYRSTSDPTYGLRTWSYDPLGRVITVQNPDGTSTNNSYAGRAAFTADEGNGTRTVQRVSQIDFFGRLLSVCEVSSTTLPGSSGTPGNCGQDISKTGFLTTYQYDALGDLISATQAGLSTRTFLYDSFGRISSAYNPESGTTTYAYDNNGNLSTKTDARNAVLSYCYDSLNRITSKSYSLQTCPNPPSPAAIYTYDAAVDNLTISNPVGRLVKAATSNTASVSSYDAMGRIVSQWQCTPQNCGSGYFGLSYTYDYLGDILTSTNGAGITLTQNFDGVARLQSVSSSWVDANHPLTLISGPSGTSGIQYSAFGNFSSALLGNGFVENVVYNNRSWINSITSSANATPATGSVSINGSEKSIAATPGTGRVTVSLSGDRCTSGESGLAKISVSTYTASTTWTCGSTVSSIASALASSLSSSTVVSATASVGVISITAKSTGSSTNYSLSVSTTSNGSTFPFSLTRSGTTLTGGANAQYDSGTVSITVNGVAASVSYGQSSTTSSVASALTSAINGSGSMPVTASASSNVVTVTTKSAGATVNYSLSSSSQTNNSGTFGSPSFSGSTSGSTLTGGSGGTAYSLTVNHAGNGDVSNLTDSVNGTWSYVYDDFNRLTTATSSAGACSGLTLTWQYDRFGNRLSQSASGTTSCTAYQPQLTFTGSNNRIDGWSYDAAGDLLGDSVHNYAYDTEGRISSVDSGATTYVYDANGQRVRKTTGGTSVDYLYDFGGHEIVELSSSGNLNRAEVYAGSRHLATYALGTTYFIHTDSVGSERARSLPNGAVAETCSSYPFGDGQSCSGTDPSPMHFTGKERDTESGLDDFDARHYASTMGRFMQPDPVGGHNEDPQTLNRYAYVRNNPLSLTDPTGLDFYLSCQTASNTCGKDAAGNLVQGTTTTTTNANGDTTSTFNPTVVTSASLQDPNSGNTGTVNQNGVQITSNGQTSEGIFINGTPSADLAGSGKLEGLLFNVNGSDEKSGNLDYGNYVYTGSRNQSDVVKLLGERGGFQYGPEKLFGNYHHEGELNFRFSSGAHPNLFNYGPSLHMLVSQDPRATVPVGPGYKGNFHVDAKTGPQHSVCAETGVGCTN